jgi:hypothetical protein
MIGDVMVSRHRQPLHVMLSVPTPLRDAVKLFPVDMTQKRLSRDWLRVGLQVIKLVDEIIVPFDTTIIERETVKPHDYSPALLTPFCIDGSVVGRT